MHVYKTHLIIVDALANSVSTTIDTTKNVASTAVDKGSSLVNAAKGMMCDSLVIFK